MGGHASHKGTSEKPNTNAEESLDTAADLGVDPNQITPPKGEDEVRSRRAPKNEKATKEASES